MNHEFKFKTRTVLGSRIQVNECIYCGMRDTWAGSSNVCPSTLSAKAKEKAQKTTLEVASST